MQDYLTYSKGTKLHTALMQVHTYVGAENDSSIVSALFDLGDFAKIDFPSQFLRMKIAMKNEMHKQDRLNELCADAYEDYYAM